MLRLRLIFVGKTSFAEADAGIQRYLERLRHYVPVDVHVIKAEKIAPGSAGSEDAAREREGERILKLPEKQDFFIAWDQRGKQLSSVDFSNYLERLKNEGAANVWMAVGGPVGLSLNVIQRANTTLSLSKMTFPHDLARFIIVEQLYRAFTILKGEPYHK